MISIEIHDHATADIESELTGLMNFAADLSGLEQAIITTVQNVNQADRLQGLDREGNHLTGLRPATLKRRQGDPTPFVEHGTNSRVIKNLVVDVEFPMNHLELRMTWFGCGFLYYHKEGAGRLPVRDILGLRAETVGLLDSMVVAESDREFARMIEASKQRGFFGRARDRIAGFFGR